MSSVVIGYDTVIVSVQREDIVSIKYIQSDSSIEIEKDKIIEEYGQPIDIVTMDTGACRLKYYGEFGYERIMFSKM